MKEILELIREDKIDGALLKIQSLVQKPRDLKEKKSLQDLYDYIRHNRQGIHAVKHIPDKALRSQVGNTGAIESNIDKFINHRMKKKGMSWSMKGALGLLKVKQLIANDEWNAWWTHDRTEKIKINLKPFNSLSSKQLWKKTREENNRLLEFELPALCGRDQTKPWAKVLRELSARRF